MAKKNSILIYLAILVTAALCAACTIAPEKAQPQQLRLVIINNTAPGSPYAAYPASVKSTLARIQSLNPVFIMHTGNIIHGGFSWMGVRAQDMHTQFQNFYRLSERLSTLLYTTVGPLDTLDGHVSIYSRHTGHESYYSFNYGNNHFVVLNSTESRDNGISGQQYNWLSEDLEESTKCCSIIVFMYHCPMNGSRGRKHVPEPAFPGAEKLHSLFSLYKVKAVLSSDGKSFTSFSHDNVHYYQVPCLYPEKKRYSRHNQYYIIDAGSEKLDISGHSIY